MTKDAAHDTKKLVYPISDGRGHYAVSVLMNSISTSVVEIDIT